MGAGGRWEVRPAPISGICFTIGPIAIDNLTTTTKRFSIPLSNLSCHVSAKPIVQGLVENDLESESEEEEEEKEEEAEGVDVEEDGVVEEVVEKVEEIEEVEVEVTVSVNEEEKPSPRPTPTSPPLCVEKVS